MVVFYHDLLVGETALQTKEQCKHEQCKHEHFFCVTRQATGHFSKVICQFNLGLSNKLKNES